MINSKKNYDTRNRLVPHLKFFSIILYIGSISSLFPQETNLHEKRYLKYKPRDIQNTMNELKDRPQELITNLKEKLSEFYLADLSQKKIQARKKVNYGVYNSEANEIEFLNTNSRRLRIRKITRKQIKGFLLEEALPLFMMHKAVAKNLLRISVPRIYESEFHFKQALRYRTLRLTPEIFTSKKRLELLDEDDPQIKLANQYRTNQNGIKQTEKEIKTLKEKNIILDDSLYFSKETNKIRQQILINEQLIVKKNQTLKLLQNSFATFNRQYQKEADQWHQDSANFLVNFAELQKNIANKLKDRQKIINKNSLYQTSFNQAVDYDYTQNSDFRAYAELLGLAVDLDKSNPITALKLAREYKNIHRNKKATFYFKQSIQFNKKAKEDFKLTDQEFKEALISLANISYQEKKFVDAAKYYEKTIQLEDDMNLLYLLGSLHYQRTGHYQRAIELLTIYFNKLNDEEEDLLEITEKAKKTKKKFLALHYITQSYRKIREYKIMLESFQKLRDMHVEFVRDIQSQKEKISNSFKELKEIKKTILDKTDRENLTQFYLAENKHRNNKITLAKLKTIKNALPLKNLYFNLAEYWEEQNNFPQAIEIYQEAQKYGIQPNQARRKVIALQKLQ